VCVKSAGSRAVAAAVAALASEHSAFRTRNMQQPRFLCSILLLLLVTSADAGAQCTVQQLVLVTPPAVAGVSLAGATGDTAALSPKAHLSDQNIILDLVVCTLQPAAAVSQHQQHSAVLLQGNQVTCCTRQGLLPTSTPKCTADRRQIRGPTPQVAGSVYKVLCMTYQQQIFADRFVSHSTIWHRIWSMPALPPLRVTPHHPPPPHTQISHALHRQADCVRQPGARGWSAHSGQ
jgi:hypothetical protein